jgi:hypothetical protein
VTGSDGFTCMTLGTRTSPATGATPLMKLKLSFWWIVALMEFDVPARSGGIAVGRRMYYRLGGDIAGSAWPVLDNEGLA